MSEVNREKKLLSKMISSELGNEFEVSTINSGETIIIIIYDKKNLETGQCNYEYEFELGDSINDILKEILADLFYYHRKELKRIKQYNHKKIRIENEE